MPMRSGPTSKEHGTTEGNPAPASSKSCGNGFIAGMWNAGREASRCRIRWSSWSSRAGIGSGPCHDHGVGRVQPLDRPADSMPGFRRNGFGTFCRPIIRRKASLQTTTTAWRRTSPMRRSSAQPAGVANGASSGEGVNRRAGRTPTIQERRENPEVAIAAGAKRRGPSMARCRDRRMRCATGRRQTASSSYPLLYPRTGHCARMACL